MLFNSTYFFIFLTIVLLGYLFVKHREQNILLLVSSYIFYGWWDWRFLGLIAFSTFIDFYLAKKLDISKDEKHRKLLVTTSLLCNLAVLGFFKYFNFFTESLKTLLNHLGISAGWTALDIILPVGISFYTFQTLSYTIDVYRKRLKPTEKFLDFALFVAFFPQLVAGPIERASHLLPQVSSSRHRDSAQFQRGVFLILFGLFKKIVIADSVAGYVNLIFNSDQTQPGINIVIATLLFTFQIYCDFSGYTDIARGVAKTLGFNFSLNFNLPYFSKNPKEFWLRWHISLSSWLRDYLYISMGGNKKGSLMTYRNLIVTMLLGGLWHGAAWNFIMWGFYQGGLLVCHRLMSPLLERIFVKSKLTNLFLIFFYFIFTCYGWLIFRANSISQIIDFSCAMGSNIALSKAMLPTFSTGLLFGFPVLMLMDVCQYISNNTRYYERWFLPFRYALYSVLIVLITLSVGNTPEEFIYFQF